MSYLLSVFSESDLTIPTSVFSKKTSEIFTELLNLEQFCDLGFSFKSNYLDKDSLLELKSVHSVGIAHSAFFGVNLCFSYEKLQFWEYYGNQPLFDFTISEIPREANRIEMILSLVLVLSFAELTSTQVFRDDSGIWSDVVDNGIPISDIYKLKNKESLFLKDALNVFFSNIRLLPNCNP